MQYANAPPSKWGPILIVGGSGRLGFFIACKLREQPECGLIVSISRSSKIAHPCNGVDYHVADIRDSNALRTVLQQIKPETIINCAAPAHTNTRTPSSEFEQVFIKGQDTLMALAKEIGTKYMICTTSSSVIKGYNHFLADETAPLWPDNAGAFPYWIQRARAEKCLLAIDDASFQTVSLRLPLIIGERDYAFVPATLKTMEEGNTAVQIGSDRGLLTTVSANDAARAHVLALRAVMKPKNNVHGEAFYIIGKNVKSFWTMVRIIWSEAGWVEQAPRFVVPEWAARLMAVVLETIMTPFGIEPQLTTHKLRIMCNTWTYNGAKARDRLGYVPEDDTEDQLRRAVRWHLEHHAD